MITIKLPIQLSNDAKAIIRELRKQQTSCIGIALRAINSGAKQKELTQKLNSLNNITLDSWMKQSAVYEAKTLASTKHKNILFGGKTNWKQYLKGIITKEQFKENRLFPLCVVGEAPQRGNRKASLNISEGHILLKLDKNTHISVVIPKLRANYKKQLLLLEQRTKAKETPFSIKLTDTYICISFEEQKIEQIKGNNVLALDLNPNFIGLSIQNSKQDILFTKLYDIIALTNADKQRHELSIINNEIIKLCRQFNVGHIAVEELSSLKTKNHGKGKKFNKLINNKWNRNFLQSNLKRKCSLYGLKFCEVNAAYSSVIGNLVNTEYVDAVASSIEIGRRAMAVFVKSKKDRFYPKLISGDVLSNRWKEAKEWSYSTWKDLFSCLKNSKLRYRISVPDGTVFKTHQTHKSFVYVYNGVA